MADKSVMAHVGAKKVETRVNDIFAIKQSLGKGLRDFIARFNRVRMTSPNVSEGMAITAFQNGLSRKGSKATKKLLSRLMKYPPTTWDEIHNAYCAKVRADDDDLNGPTRRLTSVQSEPRKEHTDNMKRDYPVPGPDRERHQPYVRTPAPPPFRYEDGLERWSTPLRSSEQSDKGRNTLAIGRERPGPLKPSSPARAINLIIGGSGDASINDIKFTSTHKLKRSITHERYDGLEESIIFDELDADGLTFPHNDALVITLRILDTDVKRIMVDNGSGACIIHL
uniref:Uncharacterized protein n=1 Tax=Nicotiana tabacum TaxID=4097 RepID=A0A1S3X8E9_TOBAC|nr:PREDICTED: uncharacterized protein LOC107762238 [Nicotiana tabacum]